MDKIDTPGTSTTDEGSVINQILLGRLLKMAQQYQCEGNLRQATELCWTLVDEHPGTLQAKEAKVMLLMLAEGYERSDDRHMARSMYERLMALEE